MGRRSLAALLCLCLLAGCAAPVTEETPSPTPAVKVTPTPEPTSTPEPTPYPWKDSYEETDRYATLADFDHIPLDTLPQELLDSLELTEERDLEGMYVADWGVYRTYTAHGLELHTSAPTAAYLEYKAEVDKDNYPTEEDFWADIEGEEGREWLVYVVITGGDYATLPGLKVGMTAQEATELGYPVKEKRDYVAGFGHHLSITMEGDVVSSMRGSWGLGRYIGKFFEL